MHYIQAPLIALRFAFMRRAILLPVGSMADRTEKGDPGRDILRFSLSEKILPFAFIATRDRQVQT